MYVHVCIFNLLKHGFLERPNIKSMSENKEHRMFANILEGFVICIVYFQYINITAKPFFQNLECCNYIL